MTEGPGRPAYVLLTRFNPPSRGYESIVRSSDDWLRKRAQLFERFCLPSVVAQTDQDFSWIVYFDPLSPAQLMRKSDTWQSYQRFHSIFREEVSLAAKQADIRRYFRPSGRGRLIAPGRICDCEA